MHPSTRNRSQILVRPSRGESSRFSRWLLERERALTLFELVLLLAITGPALGWAIGLAVGWLTTGTIH